MNKMQWLQFWLSAGRGGDGAALPALSAARLWGASEMCLTYKQHAVKAQSCSSSCIGSALMGALTLQEVRVSVYTFWRDTSSHGTKRFVWVLPDLPRASADISKIPLNLLAQLLLEKSCNNRFFSGKPTWEAIRWWSYYIRSSLP